MVCLLGVKRGASKGGMKNPHFHCLVGQDRGEVGGFGIFHLGSQTFGLPNQEENWEGGNFYIQVGPHSLLLPLSTLHLPNFTSPQSNKVLLRFMWFNPYNGNLWVTSIKLHMDNNEQLLNAIIYYIISTSKS